MLPVVREIRMGRCGTNKAEPQRRKVRKIRAAIRVGVYENDLKLHIAIERLIERLSRGDVQGR